MIKKLEEVASRILGGKTKVLLRKDIEHKLLASEYAGIAHLGTDVFAVLQCERKEVYPIALHAMLTQTGQQRLLIASKKRNAKYSLSKGETEAGLQIGHVTALGAPTKMKGRNGGYYYRNNPVDVDECPGIVISDEAAQELRQAIEEAFPFLMKTVGVETSNVEEEDISSYSDYIAEDQ